MLLERYSFCSNVKQLFKCASTRLGCSIAAVCQRVQWEEFLILKASIQTTGRQISPNRTRLPPVALKNENSSAENREHLISQPIKRKKQNEFELRGKKKKLQKNLIPYLERKSTNDDDRKKKVSSPTKIIHRFTRESRYLGLLECRNRRNDALLQTDKHEEIEEMNVNGISTVRWISWISIVGNGRSD